MEKDRQDRQKKLAESRRKNKKNKKSSKTSKADIIGKGSPKGRVKGGVIGAGAKDRITKQDILHAQELLNEVFKGKIKPKGLKPQKPKDPKKADGKVKGGVIGGAMKPKVVKPQKPRDPQKPKAPKKPDGKAQGGMMVKGQGAAIRGTKFKGTF